MHIRTFVGWADDLTDAIAEAEKDAQQLLLSLNPSELISVQAQSLVDRWPDPEGVGRACFHVITVIYR